MSAIITTEYASPCGTLVLADYKGHLCLCDWTVRKNVETIYRRLHKGLNTNFENGETALLKKAIEQLDEYFAGTRQSFDLPLELVGTDFQKQVWEELLKIPYGTMVTYLDLATRIGHPQSVRAVANAVGANPVSIIVPCHRIVGSDGSLTGYAGGIESKEFLLSIEHRVASL